MHTAGPHQCYNMCGTCGVGFWRRISSVRQAPWIWQRMLSSASIFSYGDMRLLCSLSMSYRMRAYFFSSDCRSACARQVLAHQLLPSLAAQNFQHYDRCCAADVRVLCSSLPDAFHMITLQIPF